MTSPANNAIVVAKADTIDSLISAATKDGRKVLLDFHAAWCGPCKQMHPMVERFANENAEVAVLTVDIDDCMQFAVKNSIRSVPTFMVLEGGVVLRTARGAQSFDNLSKLVNG